MFSWVCTLYMLDLKTKIKFRLDGEFFIEGLIEAGKILEKVLCPALKALDVVMAIGMAALPPPGRAITGGMVAAIRSAKAYKYANEAQDAAQEWADFFLSGADFAGQADCSPLVPSRDDLIKKAFTPLVDAPDELVPDFFNLRNVFSYRVYDLLADIFHNSACHVNNAYLAALDKDEVVDEADLLSRSYPIDLRYAGLEKRAKPKEGSACDYPLESFRYPSSEEWEADKPKKYGFNKRDSCDDYSMDKPDEGAGIQYDTEHVLEWQTVVQFFNTMGKEITTKFKNPDPQQNNMVGFCEYWRESWTWKDHRMNGPPASLANTPNSSPSPSPSPSLSPSPSPNLSPTPGSSPTPDPAVMQRSPIGWLASVYPWKQDGDQMWLDEMPLLESEINARYKGRLFIQTLKKSGEYEDIVAERKMKALIKGRDKKLKLSVSDQSRRAIQKMRPMIGALKYMQQDSIAEIFANQKNRIGAMIGYIDRELQKTPRRFADATKPKSQEYVIDALPWQEQGLEKKWDAYMDNVFAVAKQRATDFMTVNLDRLKDEWESSKKTEVPKNFKGDAQAKRNEKNKLEKTQKDMLALIKKTHDEWDKVKDWAMPWKSKDEKDMDDDGADQ
ncbi:uncharacterized protein J4E92_009357 [Alternaria infectoria]|uniref:uncharacterized protein n=1 Tax=Alternaria infectoria TaxID=45303 RepID=UPI0022207BDB|nr:uncharacterized protein J4E92_009357 [Alternaria infectoria]KAI4915403.1 hypothetical protein J4E92_009357 [Alternaria infectoria]